MKATSFLAFFFLLAVGAARAADTNTSTVAAYPPQAWADGTNAARITVTLRDDAGSPLEGRAVSLAAQGPGAPAITARSAASGPDGRFLFAVSSATPGAETFTATDTTDGSVIAQTATVLFVARPPDLSAYIPDSHVVTTWDFTNSVNPGWTLGRKCFPTEWGLQLGTNPPPAVDNGAWVGQMRVAPPTGISYLNGGVEMTFYAPAGPPPTEGFEFLALWRDSPRSGFTVLANRLTGTARTRQQVPESDANWSIPHNSGAGLAGLHTMAVVRYPDKRVETYVDGVKVNTRASVEPTAAMQYISIGWNVNGNMYMPFGALVSRVKAFTYSPPLGPADPDVSTVVAAPPSAWADGAARSTITVRLTDADGDVIAGKTLRLDKTAGPDGPVIAPATATTAADGTATFAVTCAAPGTNEFTVTETSDDPDVVLSAKPVVRFVSPGRVALNVNFDSEYRAGLAGPAGGAGSAWNERLGYPQMVASGLVNSNTIATSIGFTCSAYNVGWWQGPQLTMLIGGAYTGGEPSELVITNVPAGRKYDLYLPSYYYNENGSKATFTTANVTTNGATQVCDNGGKGGAHAAWIRGVNYALFQDVAPDANRQIRITITRTVPDVQAFINGFQLIEPGRLPPWRPGGPILLLH